MRLPERPAAVARILRLLDDAGAQAERRLDQLERGMSERPFGSVIFGSITALAVVSGGVIAFVAVLFVLVRFFG